MGSAFGRCDVPGFQKLCEGGMLQRFLRHLPRLSGAEKQFLSPGQGNAQRFLGFIGDFHDRYEWAKVYPEP